MQHVILPLSIKKTKLSYMISTIIKKASLKQFKVARPFLRKLFIAIGKYIIIYILYKIRIPYVVKK